MMRTNDEWLEETPPSESDGEWAYDEIEDGELVLTAGGAEPEPEVIAVAFGVGDPMALDVPSHLPNEWAEGVR